MTVERWRLQSGRGASIDLTQPAETVESLRALFQSQGAEPIHEKGPGAVGAAAEAENTPPTEKGNAMSENIIAETTDTRETLTPIYGPADPRWGELAAWLSENGDRITDDEGHRQASIDGEWDGLAPAERAAWHAIHVRGLDPRQVVRMEIEYPSIPDDVEGPAWFAGDGPEHGGIGIEDELPRACWERTLYDDDTTRVDIWREDTYRPDSGEVVAGADELKVWIDGEPVELAGELSTAAGLTKIVEGLVAALRVAVTL